MKKNEKQLLPKDFFSQSRPTISAKEALKDVVPIRWNKEVVDGNKKTIVNSVKLK